MEILKLVNNVINSAKNHRFEESGYAAMELTSAMLYAAKKEVVCDKDVFCKVRLRPLNAKSFDATVTLIDENLFIEGIQYKQSKKASSFDVNELRRKIEPFMDDVVYIYSDLREDRFNSKKFSKGEETIQKLASELDELKKLKYFQKKKSFDWIEFYLKEIALRCSNSTPIESFTFNRLKFAFYEN